MRRRTRLLCAALVGAAAVCAPGGSGPRETLETFLEAVQSEDLDRLFCLSAGAATAQELGSNEALRRAGFAEWAFEQYERYRQGRGAGWVDLGDHGIPLVKLFSLGRGAYFTYDGAVERERNRRVLRTTIRFGYDHVDLSSLSPGTTFYVSGVPVGRVHAVRVPAGPKEVRLEVMDTIAVDWTLVRQTAAGSCPAGWAVASVVPVEGSVTSGEVTWVF